MYEFFIWYHILFGSAQRLVLNLLEIEFTRRPLCETMGYMFNEWTVNGKDSAYKEITKAKDGG